MDAVLRATIAELGEVGLEGLRVERVAEAAGVNKTSVYRRWATREALAAAALAALAGDVLPAEPGGRGREGSVEAELLSLATTVAELFRTPAGKALVQAALADATGAEIAALGARGLGAGVRTPADRLADRARARGEWRAGVAPDLVVFTIVGAVMHRVLLERRRATRPWLRALVDLVLHGAAASRPRARRRGPARG